ncbi:30S ribosomal protein S6 [bacterium (Candidatus Moisslbacteria) CG12_big_fil_rev_8_21_14_0_65_36_11]|nr:30S ribosomal protein S6 [Candidatus Kuenenbacteria bacterium]OIP76295.1 MAG: 30S ribosomal protein S6 [Parcubacteria group bacterium CG2_30_36_38]PIV46218.1 MAG: 30S ribosomal protein S6 [bacterium (Candidatus Moisslbacteria) CG02_land_8_20_14_3_00_36_53]PIW68032.1 MAG: 30S ribosomal protein S6 [bacterium (Candidatus Moisslbacteria) CG12_big_fil_rev_8_21_14_0_65_36_11]PIZ90182.1 MAG: 30S ribosomal protein S6 [bacterium (Candidatus Moisslbacteria) CG_4_10_14_0_2_um_filter_36_61]PJC00767.1 M
MYELLTIIPAPFTEKDLSPVSIKIKDLVEKQGGKVLGEKILGERKFAYKIKHATKGFYLLFNLEVDPLKLKLLNEKLLQVPEVLRSLIIKK